MRRQHGGLPRLTFIHFAIAQNQKCAAASPLQPVAQRLTHRQRTALPERSGGHIHAGGLVPIAVRRKARARLIQRFDFIIGKEALHGERGVHRRPRVSLGAYQLIPIRPARIFRIIAHGMAVEHGEQIAHAQHAAHMAKAPRLKLLHRADANLQCQLLQLRRIVHVDAPPQTIAARRSARTTGSSSPVRKRISAPPPVHR